MPWNSRRSYLLACRAESYKFIGNVQWLKNLRTAPTSCFTASDFIGRVRRFADARITDTLVDLLLEIVHRLELKAERKVDKELLEDLKRVTGKNNLLFQLAQAALEHPEGIVKDVVYPIVPEQTLRDLVKEWRASGPAYRQRVTLTMRNSYRSHYRRMLPRLLHTLEFRSNNDMHRRVIAALDLLRR